MTTTSNEPAGEPMTATMTRGAMTAAETRSAVAHLGRRAGFGLPADAIDELAAGGYPAAVDRLVDGLGHTDAAATKVAPPTFDTAGYVAARASKDQSARQAANRAAKAERIALIRWWLQRMVVADEPLHEKLTLCWHDHFATSLTKVKVAEVMYVQYRTLYGQGPGRFDDLLGAVARDPAMLRWLDGVENTGTAPNENLGRELLELFTLGHGAAHATSGQTDHGAGAMGAAAQPYSEMDVKEAARALTGWRIDRGTLTGTLVPRRHDNGTKTLLGATGPFGLDDVVRLTTRHAACAPHVVSRLWSRLGRPAGPDDPVVQSLAAPFARDLDTTALLRRLFLHPEFLAPATRTALVKTPVEWAVGTLRTLRLPLSPSIEKVLVGLGQLPFAPPDVSGWPSNEAWLSTASARIRLQWARSVAATADLHELSATPERDRPSAVARLLGVDAWGTTTGRALASAASQPATLLTLAIIAPEHLLA